MKLKNISKETGRVIECMGLLTSKEVDILVLRYCYGETLEEIGKKYGVTRERVRQIEEVAYNKLDSCLNIK